MKVNDKVHKQAYKQAHKQACMVKATYHKAADHKAADHKATDQKAAGVHTLYRHQAGATLIMTLVVLLIISIVAVMSVRRSSADLAISTAAQVQNVLFQSAEIGMSLLEDEARTGKISDSGNIIPYLKMPGTANDRIGNEVTFCVRPRENRFFNNAKVSEKSANGGHVGGLANGYCDPSALGGEDYISARKTTMLQLTVEKRKPRTKGEVFSLENDRATFGGAPIEGNKERFKPVAFKVTSTAVLPAFAKDMGNVKDCMKKSAKAGTEKDEFTDACLQNEEAPQVVTEQGYIFRVFDGL